MVSVHPWLMVNCEQVDGAFCVACAIFCADPKVLNPMHAALYCPSTEKKNPHPFQYQHKACMMRLWHKLPQLRSDEKVKAMIMASRQKSSS